MFQTVWTLLAPLVYCITERRCHHHFTQRSVFSILNRFSASERSFVMFWTYQLEGFVKYPSIHWNEFMTFSCFWALKKTKLRKWLQKYETFKDHSFFKQHTYRRLFLEAEIQNWQKTFSNYYLFSTIVVKYKKFANFIANFAIYAAQFKRSVDGLVGWVTNPTSMIGGFYIYQTKVLLSTNCIRFQLSQPSSCKELWLSSPSFSLSQVSTSQRTVHNTNIPRTNCNLSYCNFLPYGLIKICV